jgi:hypothetical protein
MNLIFTFFSIFSLNLYAESCSVELFSKILKTDKEFALAPKELIKHSECSQKINSQIIETIGKNIGEIQVSSIEKSFLDDQVHITPRKINITELNTFLREQLTTDTNLYFFNTKTIGGNRSIGLNENEIIRAVCESCFSVGDRNIKIEIQNPIDNKVNTIWVNSKLFAKLKVYRAKNSINFQTHQLSADHFIQDEIYSIQPDFILTSLENIRFFKPNKNIMAGSIVNSTDIMPVPVIQYGIPTRVTLKTSSLSLTKMAVPTRSAQLGETVELRIDQNKTIMGKAIDYNQVVIEL